MKLLVALVAILLFPVAIGALAGLFVSRHETPCDDDDFGDRFRKNEGRLL